MIKGNFFLKALPKLPNENYGNDDHKTGERIFYDKKLSKGLLTESFHNIFRTLVNN